MEGRLSQTNFRQEIFLLVLLVFISSISTTIVSHLIPALAVGPAASDFSFPSMLQLPGVSEILTFLAIWFNHWSQSYMLLTYECHFCCFDRTWCWCRWCFRYYSEFTMIPLWGKVRQKKWNSLGGQSMNMFHSLHKRRYLLHPFTIINVSTSAFIICFGYQRESASTKT